MDPTLDDIEAIRRDDLARRRLPDGRTWLALTDEIASKAGADLGEVVLGCRRARAAFARHAAWVALREHGYSYPEIAKAWGFDHTTVMAGIKKATGAPRQRTKGAA